MNKIEAYNDIIEREIEPTRNFLDGLLYLDEFTFVYNILKTLNFEYEIIPSFTYSEQRENLQETMREFKLRVLNLKLNLEDIAMSIVNAYSENTRFSIECHCSNDMLTIKLL